MTNLYLLTYVDQPCYTYHMTQKILFSAPDDMYEALKKEAAKRDMPMSAIIRISVAEWLGYQGERVTREIKWGGKRDGK